MGDLSSDTIVALSIRTRIAKKKEADTVVVFVGLARGKPRIR
jgi:hypothetical protein